jgi:hypothetical protein
MQIYIVYFITGEYGDKSEHILKVFANSDKANEYAEKVRSDLNCMGRHDDINGDNSKSENINTRYDMEEYEGCTIDYTGAYVLVSAPIDVEG